MDIQSYFLFVGASVVLCIVPGPDMAFVLTKCIAQGKKAGLLAAVGINAGAYVHLLAVLLGLSSILLASSVAFTLIKWIGAAYLIYIGIQAMRSSSQLNIGINVQARQKGNTIFLQGFFSDVLNPKVAIFFLAFLPQFINSDSQNPVLQLVVLGITVNIIGLVINFLLVYFSATMTENLRENPVISSWLNKLMGAVIIALGLRLANEKL